MPIFGDKHDPEFLRSVFDRTEILRKPMRGIVTGYHILPYILVAPQEEQTGRSVEIRGKIRVSPRFVISPSQLGQTYGEFFNDREEMDGALIGRVFGFLYTPRLNVIMESEEFKIQKSDRDPRSQINRALDELMRREIIDTGLILAPHARFYPISVDRFIHEILDQEFK